LIENKKKCRKKTNKGGERGEENNILNKVESEIDSPVRVCSEKLVTKINKLKKKRYFD